jgi:arginase family enzyme
MWGAVELTDEVLEQTAREGQDCLYISGCADVPDDLRWVPDRPTPVRLDPELRKALDRRAATDNMTASDVVREALRRYLKVS